jgi:hypothetical protein
MQLKKNDYLITPEWVWKPLGHIDLDPCAGLLTAIGQENWRIESGQNGLEKKWFGFVYCNPPFSQKEIWIQKMINHGDGILLLPERGSAPWFGPLAYSVRTYWVMGKKINFIGGTSSNNLGSCLFLFGDEAEQRLIDSGLPGHMVDVKLFRPRECA